MSHFRFDSYSRDELERCGEAFVADIAMHHRIFCAMTDSAQWTDYLFDWFSCAAPTDTYTYAHSPRASVRWQALFGRKELAHRVPGPRVPSEFMLDLTHIELKPISTAGDSLVSVRSHVVRLGLESEWGHQTSPTYNVERVLFDASKLATVRAEAKAMLFASTGPQNHDQIVHCLGETRRSSGDASPWLWIDVPWTWDRRTNRWEPSFGVLSGDKRRDRGSP